MQGGDRETGIVVCALPRVGQTVVGTYCGAQAIQLRALG